MRKIQVVAERASARFKQGMLELLTRKGVVATDPGPNESDRYVSRQAVKFDG